MQLKFSVQKNEKMESSKDDAIDYLIIHFVKKEPYMYDKRNPKYLKKKPTEARLI